MGAAPTARLSVETNKSRVTISPLLYGIFFEEINRAGDGSIYAEMVQNRSFEDAVSPLAWRRVASDHASARIALDKSLPLNA